MRRVTRAYALSVGSAALALVVWLAAVPSAAFDDHVFVVTIGGETGTCAAHGIYPPWIGEVDLETVGTHSTVRHFDGLHYVVNRSPDDNVQVIDPGTFETILQFSVGAGSNPHDILVVD